MNGRVSYDLKSMNRPASYDNESFHDLLLRTGDWLEDLFDAKISPLISDAPAYDGTLTRGGWVKLYLEKGLSGDGSPYHIYLRRGSPRKLCIFFSGGGIAWDSYSASRPFSGGRLLAGEKDAELSGGAPAQVNVIGGAVPGKALF